MPRPLDLERPATPRLPRVFPLRPIVVAKRVSFHPKGWSTRGRRPRSVSPPGGDVAGVQRAGPRVVEASGARLLPRAAASVDLEDHDRPAGKAQRRPGLDL